MSHRMEVWEEKKDRHWIVRIDPIFDPENKRRGRRSDVTVFSEKDFAFETQDYAWGRAQVSFGSYGACDPDIAEAYGKALAFAVERARQMDREHGFDVPHSDTQAASK